MSRRAVPGLILVGDFQIQGANFVHYSDPIISKYITGNRKGPNT